ncbi:hypothetical protein [Methylobacterium sp. J-090]|uniref:hypothetical protein n=1 Tax=Methylobacterium sp. J-090 TaxID=2836666 RepID=UPI001FBAD8AA|nr:hypothetical protein [Methylobacterium sp. J-090]MCJ2080746.1 hypothetical protein [Methylobacterium sp. J-090]
MSVVAYAIRTRLGAALVGRTLAGGRVYDSAVQPIEELIRAEPQPFLVISTDDEEITPRGWALLDADRELNFVVEIAIGGMTRIDLPEAEGGGAALRLDIPHTDDGLETTLNMVGREIMREIQVGGPWSDLLRDITFGLKKVTIRRGSNTEQGTRFAARQYVFTTDTIAEPDFGAEPEGIWVRLLDLMQADPRLSGAVPLMRRMIVGDALPDWRRVQVDLGLTDRSYRTLGLGPLFTGVGEPLAQRLIINGPRRTAIVEPEPTP